MQHGIKAIFEPRSVAVIGASRNPEKWGNLMARSLIDSDYTGELYLVNPKGEEILGRKTFSSILDIKETIDLAIIGIPVKKVEEAVSDCIKKGVKSIVIVTAHFGEYSQEGRHAEVQIFNLARNSGTRIVGPNCIGVYNSSICLNTTFSPLPPGNFAFLTQSGNLGLEVSYFAGKRGLGFSKFVSLGNQVDVLFHELLDYIKDDPDTSAVLLYIEGVKEGRKFLEVAREAARIKPIITVKVGVGEAGVRAAASHTGALAGHDDIYDAVFRQAGIIRAVNSTDLLDMGEALVKCPLPRGNRVGIICNGGGAGTLSADVAGKYGLEVPVMSASSQNQMETATLPDALHAKLNPVDFADEADPWAWVKLAGILLQDDDIDALVAVGGYGGYEDSFPQLKATWVEMAYELANLQTKYKKPVIVQSYFLEDNPESLQVLREQGVPVYINPDTAMKCLGALVTRRKYLDQIEEEEGQDYLSLPEDRKRKCDKIISSVRANNRQVLTEVEARDILEAYGLQPATGKLVSSSEDAVSAAKEIGYPVVLKVISPDIVHKSDAGCVKLNLACEEDVHKAFDEAIRNARKHYASAEIWGCLVDRMKAGGIEIIAGVVKDQTFGPTVMFGLGGIFCEVLKDVSFRVAPIKRGDAYRMIREIKGYPVLAGARGTVAADIEAIVDILLRLSAFVEENPDIAELDLNPVVVFEKGAAVLDARMLLGPVV